VRRYMYHIRVHAGDNNFRKHLQGMYATYVNNAVLTAGMFPDAVCFSSLCNLVITSFLTRRHQNKRSVDAEDGL
jgi:hypothetical protein